MADISLAEYWEECAAHDWTYMYSDSHQVYLEGDRELKSLMKSRGISTEHTTLFNNFRAWAKNGIGNKPLKPD